MPLLFFLANLYIATKPRTKSSKKMQHADLANGIAVVDAAGVEDHFKQKAPFFCACFPMHDSTCVPEDAKRLLYALCRTEQCIESGVVTQGFLHGRMGTEENYGYLICSASVHKGGKPLIAEEIEGDGTRYSLRPMRVTMRVYRAAGGEHIAYYMWVTVESPLPFSLRHAVFETLHKQRNEEWAPEVKRIWNMIITHVRHPHCYMTAANEEQKTSAWNQNLDWIQESNDESFTAMFSAKRALEWLVLDFSHRHEGVALEGVRGFSDHTEMMNGDFIKSCVHYDVDVDNWLKKGLKKRKRPAAASQQQQSTQDSAQPEPEQEEEQLLPPVPPSGCAFAETKRGLPPCAYAMELYATISTNARGYSAFDSMIKTLPLSVQNGICADMVGLRLDPTEQPAELAPTLQQSRVIISGGYNPLQQNKTSFACGDKHWHNHNMSSIHKLPPAERYIGLQRMLQAAVQLSFSRAEGSDGYTNMRAGAYFSYARKHAQGPSRRDCRAMYEHGVFNCGTTAALQRMGSTFLRCNRLGFYLRPDNLHLLQLLCVSDIMQCLNFHNQAIRCAPNGIGATIVIRNGGGHYRRADGRRKELEVCNKTNGSGADITIGVLISMVGDLSIYDPQSPSLQMWDELRKSSEHGLLQRICVRIEGVGSDKVVASTAIDMSMRLYATELRVQNDASSNATITALSQLIPRNTLADTENSILTTEVPPFAVGCCDSLAEDDPSGCAGGAQEQAARRRAVEAGHFRHPPAQHQHDHRGQRARALHHHLQGGAQRGLGGTGSGREAPGGAAPGRGQAQLHVGESGHAQPGGARERAPRLLHCLRRGRVHRLPAVDRHAGRAAGLRPLCLGVPSVPSAAGAQLGAPGPRHGGSQLTGSVAAGVGGAQRGAHAPGGGH